jgi:hypothetical protein
MIRCPYFPCGAEFDLAAVPTVEHAELLPQAARRHPDLGQYEEPTGRISGPKYERKEYASGNMRLLPGGPPSHMRRPARKEYHRTIYVNCINCWQQSAQLQRMQVIGYGSHSYEAGSKNAYEDWTYTETSSYIYFECPKCGAFQSYEK